MRNKFVLGAALVVLLVLLWAAGSAIASPPKEGPGDRGGAIALVTVPALINYQGRLTDPTGGDPMADGNYTMTFSLYNVSTGGPALWTETKTVSLSGGLFNTLLGDTSPLAPSLFDGSDLWLGVSVGGNPEMIPRQQIVSVAYAFQAQNADTLDGAHASAFALGTHTHDDRYYTEGELNTSDGNAPNVGSNRVHWDNLTGVPSGFADGVDDMGVGPHDHWGESWSGTGTGLQLTSTDGGTGVHGDSNSGIGVLGTSISGAGGVFTGNEGLHATGDVTGVTGIGGLFETGVYGEAPSGVGVMGKGDAGVVGDGQIGVQGTGLRGVVGESTLDSGIGVRGDSTQGDGVYGETSSPRRNEAGVHGKSTNLAPGVLGEAAASNGVVGVGGDHEYGGSFTGGSGVYAESSTGLGVGVEGVSSDNYGVRGDSTNSHGVYGTTSATAGHGVHGEVAGSAATGVYGESAGMYGLGVAGYGTGSSGTGVYGSGTSNGVHGSSEAGTGVFGSGGFGTGVKGSGASNGVWGVSSSGTAVMGEGGQYGVYGRSDLGIAIFGSAADPASVNPAVFGYHAGAGAGVYGDSEEGPGVYGTTDSTEPAVKGENPQLSGVGVYGESLAGTGVKGSGHTGVEGDGVMRGVYGHSAVGYGLYGSSTTGTAIYADGDVAQGLSDNGLVKAAVYAYCVNSGAATVYRHFNNVNDATITISGGSGTGQCIIDFGFNVGTRYIVVTAHTSSVARGVTVLSTSGTTATFFRWNADGNGVGGAIAVLVY